MTEIMAVTAQISALTFILTSMLANFILVPALADLIQMMVMLVAILGLILLMVVGGEMGKRVTAKAPDGQSADT
jgi:protein-S-isoprenylcysteine O-methyltransferase Ste14